MSIQVRDFDDSSWVEMSFPKILATVVIGLVVMILYALAMIGAILVLPFYLAAKSFRPATKRSGEGRTEQAIPPAYNKGLGLLR